MTSTPRLIVWLSLTTAVMLLAAACGDAASELTRGGAAASSTTTVAATATSIAPTTPDAPTSSTVTLETTPPTTSAPTTTAAPTSTASTTTVPPEPPRVLLVGDSTLLAIESYQAQLSLNGFDPVLEVASCRTLGVPSCGSTPVPPNSVEIIGAQTETFDGVVIMAGYDEWWTSFGSSFAAVMDVSRDKGASWVLWLSYPESVPYLLPDGRTANESFVAINAQLREFAEDPLYPDLLIADWGTYLGHDEAWVTGDGIHLHPAGAYAVGDYISRWVAAIEGLACPKPLVPGDQTDEVCSPPDLLDTAPDITNLYFG